MSRIDWGLRVHSQLWVLPPHCHIALSNLARTAMMMGSQDDVNDLCAQADYHDYLWLGYYS